MSRRTAMRPPFSRAVSSGLAALLLGFAGPAMAGAAAPTAADRTALSAAYLPIKGARDLLTGVRVHDDNYDYMQNFGFGDGTIYVFTASHKDDRVAVVAKFKAGVYQGEMRFKGFQQHGGSFAIDVDSQGRERIWAKAKNATWGTILKRTPFKKGTTVRPGDLPTIHKFKASGSPIIDRKNNLFVLMTGQAKAIVEAWPLGQARRKDFSHPAYSHTFVDPRFADPKTLKQGQTVAGDYAYLYQGSPKCPGGDNCTSDADGNTYVRVIQLATGRQVAQSKVTWKSGLAWREPEGIAVRKTSTGWALVVGFVNPRYGKHKIYLAQMASGS